MICNELHDDAGYVGIIHKAEGGYIVRKPVPFQRGYGPTLFDGRVFPGSAFKPIGQSNLNRSQTVRRFKLAEAV